MFVVGQKVVYIRNIGPKFRKKWHDIDMPEKGQIYTVRETFLSPNSGEPVLLLQEIRNPDVWWLGTTTEIRREAAFLAKNFRPLIQTDISVFDKLKNPVNLNDERPVHINEYEREEA